MVASTGRSLVSLRSLLSVGSWLSRASWSSGVSDWSLRSLRAGLSWLSGASGLAWLSGWPTWAGRADWAGHLAEDSSTSWLSWVSWLAGLSGWSARSWWARATALSTVGVGSWVSRGSWGTLRSWSSGWSGRGLGALEAPVVLRRLLWCDRVWAVASWLAWSAVVAVPSVRSRWAGWALRRDAATAASAVRGRRRREMGALDAGAAAVAGGAVAGLTSHTRVDLREHLGARHFAPDVSGACLAEVHLALHHRLHVLHVVVQHRDGDDADESRHRGDRHAEEGDPAEALRLMFALLQVAAVHHCRCVG